MSSEEEKSDYEVEMPLKSISFKDDQKLEEFHEEI